MRRVVLAAILGWLGLSSAATADSWYGPRYPYHVYHSGRHCCPYGYKTRGYGMTWRGLAHSWSGFGPRYTPANGTAPNPLYFSSPVGPGQYVYSGSMQIEGTPMTTKRSPISPEVLTAPYPTTDHPTK